MTLNREITDATVAKALAHPIRVRILAILEQRRATPRQLSDELDHPLPHTSYHVKQLERHGLIDLVETRPVRGTVEHLYEARQRPEVPNEAWEQLPEIVKQALVGSALGALVEQAGEAASQGGFSRADAHLDRTAYVLDAEGMAAVSAELVELLDRVDRIQEQSAERLRQTGDQDEIRATLGLLLFEQAVRAPRKRSAAGRRGRPAGHSAAR
jgi:DNA-binding transcriptional ArsR family regulator